MQRDDIEKIKSGSRWTALGALAGVFSQIIIMLSLAVFLRPEDVGLFSIFLFVLGLGLTLLPLGNDFSFVQADALSKGDLKRTIAIGAGISLLAAGLSYPVAVTVSSFGQSIGITILFGIAVGYLEAIFLLCSAALQRHLDYRVIEKANIVRQLLTLILSLILLAVFHRVDAAFAGRLISNLVALAMMRRPLRTAVDPGRPLQALLTDVSRNILIRNALNYTSRNAEVLLATPQLGIRGFGIYDMGRRFVEQPRTLIGSVLLKFSYPMFSKIVRIDAPALRSRLLRRAYSNVVRSAALVGFPIFAVALLLADPLITDIFGPDWRAAIYVMQIFAVTAFVQVLGNNIITSALTAVGGSSVVLKVEYVVLAPRLLAIFIASFYGPVAVALATSVFILITLVWLQRELNKLSTLSFGLVAYACRNFFYAMMIGLALGWLVKLALGGSVGAIAAGISCIIVNGMVLWWLEPRLIRSKLKLIRTALKVRR